MGFLNSVDALKHQNADQEVELADMQLRANMQAQNQSFQNGLIHELQDENDELRAEVERYRALLCKPMLEIAKKSGGFKRTYEAQQKILADWVVSQKAFKEVAMQFADKLGISRDEVQKQGIAAEEVILTDQSKFGNNPEPGSLAEQFKGELLADHRAKQGSTGA